MSALNGYMVQSTSVLASLNVSIMLIRFLTMKEFFLNWQARALKSPYVYSKLSQILIKILNGSITKSKYFKVLIFITNHKRVCFIKSLYLFFLKFVFSLSNKCTYNGLFTFHLPHRSVLEREKCSTNPT